jgi:hypothetical protein
LRNIIGNIFQLNREVENMIGNSWDLRSMPKAGRLREQVENHRRACTQVLFLRKAELGFFHFLEIVTGWLVPSAGQKIPV